MTYAATIIHMTVLMPYTGVIYDCRIADLDLY